MVCDYCEKDKSNVEEILDPYQLEVYKKEVLVNLCDEYYQRACEDI